MKRTVLMLVLAGVFGALSGQSFQPFVLSGGGNSGTLSNGTYISYTIGEPVIATVSNKFTFTQGFQQPYPLFPVKTYEPGIAGVTAYVFPNPAITGTSLQLNSDRIIDLKMEIWNSLGQMMYAEKLNSAQTTVLLKTEDYSAGNYFLMLINYPSGEFLTIPFIKQ